MRTIILRLAEREQTGGALQGLVEVPGSRPVPFSGAGALLALLADAVRDTPPRPPVDTRPPSDPDPA